MNGQKYITPVIGELSLYDLCSILHSVQDREQYALHCADQSKMRSMAADVEYWVEDAIYYNKLARKIETLIGHVSPIDPPQPASFYKYSQKNAL